MVKDDIIERFGKETAEVMNCIRTIGDYFRRYATKHEYDTENVDKCCRRYAKNQTKRLEKELEKLQAIQAAEDVNEITICIEWSKARTWGNNPRCTISVATRGGYEYYKAACSGCGYDKESTVVASAFNQSYTVLKLITTAVDNGAELPYGIRNMKGYIPGFSGGVGIDCFQQVFETLGYRWKHVSSGKMSDSWCITRKV